VFGADVYDDERAKVAARLAAGDKRDARHLPVETCLRCRTGVQGSTGMRGPVCPTPVAVGGAFDLVIVTPSSSGRQLVPGPAGRSGASSEADPG
jgi:hypothetical protein